MSAIQSFLDDLLSALTAATTVEVSYVWPGPDTQADGIFFGRFEFESHISSIKTGRQHRREVVNLQVICQTFRLEAEDAYHDTLDLLEVVDNVCANNPALGGVNQVLQVTRGEGVVQRWQTGHTARLTVTVTNDARLI